ncbi:MAG TPA: hypothetical protein VEZ55_15640 [Chitinophagaceae bacterium]|nr:hypothetical protein [Chitinophagaceae bacterium]
MKATDKKNHINSLLSLQPLVSELKKMVAEDKPGARKLYDSLIKEVQAIPELLEPVQDISVLHQHSEIVEALLSTIFPPSTSANQGIYAISYPFHSETVFASPKFKELFLKDGSDEIIIPHKETNISIARASLSLAYNIILKKFYSFSAPVTASSIHPFTDEETGMVKYLELNLNAQFVNARLIDKDFSLPVNFSPQRMLDVDELKEVFPLEHFQFEGVIVVDVVDVTSEQIIAEIKDALLNINASSDVTVYADLQPHVQTLIGLKDIEVGITPFFTMNDIYLYAESYHTNSLLFRHQDAAANRQRIISFCQQIFKTNDQPLLFQSLNETNSSQNELVKYYFEQGAKSLIICPLKCDDGDLIGLLEITSSDAAKLKFQHLAKLQSATQLFSLALEKTNENLELQIDKTIKEHFTAIQPAVEWKFTEAAFNYLQNRQVHDAAKMPSITFENVYPLYGAIDVRNSSVERNNAIQLDLLEQLTMARDVLEKTSRIHHFPLLKEVKYKIDKYIASTSDNLLSDDELQIYDFLQLDIDSLFKHLKLVKPELNKIVEEYFSKLDPQRNILYQHRKEYEESITRINDVLDRFIDQEQKSVQHIFPHYFERYITDGIEFNIYVGQSLAPYYKFDDIYVKNLKLWQITMLAKAARLTNALEKRLSLPLQTTQLILAHSIPLSISFRRKERKFDVDGAYNIRYEIIKKRIDKVHLKDSEERLTQPGKVAVVYSQQKELAEYLEYIEYLQSEHLLTDNVEHVELEDTQGISGLKAVRVEVNLTNENGTPKVELSKITAQQLLRK